MIDDINFTILKSGHGFYKKWTANKCVIPRPSVGYFKILYMQRVTIDNDIIKSASQLASVLQLSKLNYK